MIYLNFSAAWIGIGLAFWVLCKLADKVMGRLR